MVLHWVIKITANKLATVVIEKIVERFSGIIAFKPS